MEYSNLFVCLMGMGTVFFGLICIVALTALLSAVCRGGRRPERSSVPPAPVSVPAAGGITPELIAAVSAAAAEDLGTDVTGIRILSIKPL